MAEQRIGWVGAGRMGFALAERLLKAGIKLSIYNRTRAKAEPLAAQGATVVDSLARPRGFRSRLRHRRGIQGSRWR